MKFLNLKIFSSKTSWLLGLLFLISIVTHYIFIYQPLKGKKWLSLIYTKPIQKTLQRVDGPLIDSDMDIRVLKVKKGNQIYLEFLSKQPSKSYIKINSVLLKGHREAYYEYWGDMISLAIQDADGDGRLDVIAPTFDKFFRPLINVVSYNPKSQKFELQKKVYSPRVIPSGFRKL